MNPVAPFALNLRHLRAVAAIAVSGSVSAAADRVSLSQPALTQGLAKLEVQLGAPLFVRRPDGMAATEAGAIVAARADEAMAQLAAAMRRGRRGAAGQSERLLTMAQLRALLALADAGSFAGAAAATGISQPSLHRATREVERIAGAVLVERRGRGVALTEAGRRIARGFRLAIGAIATALGEVSALRGRGAGTLLIGAMPLARARLLPDALAALHRRQPQLHVTVIEGAHRELLDLLRDGRIDLMVGALRTPSPGNDIVQRPLGDDQLAIVARADHPLAGEGAASASALALYPWIVGLPGAPVRLLWERMFADAGATPPAAPIDCGSVMTIRGLLLAGDFLTLLSPDQIRMELDTGLLALIPSDARAAIRTIGIAHRADWRPSTAQGDFLDLLDEASAGLSQSQ